MAKKKIKSVEAYGVMLNRGLALSDVGVFNSFLKEQAVQFRNELAAHRIPSGRIIRVRISPIPPKRKRGRK